MTGWTNKYIYASYNFSNSSGFIARGGLCLDKMAETVEPVITTESVVGEKATFTIPSVRETNIAYYRVLATSDGVGYYVVDSGVTNAQSVSVALTEELMECKLRIEVIYADSLYSYGYSESAKLNLVQPLIPSLSGIFYAELPLSVNVANLADGDSCDYKIELSNDQNDWVIAQSGAYTGEELTYTPNASDGNKFIRLSVTASDGKVYTSEIYKISPNEFSVSDITVTDENGVTADNVAPGKLYINADIYNPDEESKTVILFTAVYNAFNDRLDYVQVKPTTVGKGFSSIADTIDLETLSNYNQYERYCKMFVWDENCKPLTSAKTVSEVAILGEDAIWTMYVPDETQTVEGLVITSRHGIGANLADMNAFKAFCAKRNLAIMSCYDSNNVLKDYHKDPETAQAAVFNKIKYFAAQTNHPELETVPLATFGHSNGTNFAGGFAKDNIERMFAVMIYKSAHDWQYNYTEFYENDVPVFVIIGETDYAFGYNGHFETVQNMISTQSQNGGLAHFIQEPNVGHGHSGYKSNSIMFEFLDKAYQAKVKNATTDDDGNVVMDTIDKTKGYYGYGTWTWSQEYTTSDGTKQIYKFEPTGYLTYEEYKAKLEEDPDFKAQAWLFDEEYAQDWIEFNKNGIIETDYAYCD